MTIDRAPGTARRARRLLASAGVAVVLLLTLGLPVLAVGKPIGPTKLLDPGVDSRTTDTATPVTFTVTYWNAHDLPPEYVRVNVGGTLYAMSGAGTDWKAGVLFSVTTALPAGTHTVQFEARDAERFVDSVEAGTVAVDQAPPPPAPDPTPPPAPDPDPAPPSDPPGGGAGGSGGGSGGVAGGSGGSGSGGSSGSGAGAGGSGGGSTSGSGTTTDPGGETGGTSGGSTAPGSGPRDTISNRDHSGHTHDWAPPSGGPGSALEGPLGPTNPGPTTSAGSGGGGSRPDLPWFATAWTPSAGVESGDATGGRGSWLAALDAGVAALVLTGPGDLPPVPSFLAPTLLVTVWMAFMLFNRRRRDGEPPAADDVLQAAAGSGMGTAAVAVPVAPVDPESLMPRWRRPSLLEARKTDPIRTPAAERPRLSFATAVDDVAASGVDGSAEVERRVIRYAVIPLLDRPDEIMATRLGELVAGDQVQVEQRTGAYCHVLCPDGRRGWIHRMTLGDVVEAAPRRPTSSDAAPDAESALAALLAARGLG